MQRKYYEAYEDRYRQIHEQGLRWSHENPSKIVLETIDSFSISPQSNILEIGCGEGRDAYPLLERGFHLLATDVSEEAISFCKSKFPEFSDHFGALDCITGKLDRKFDLIYSVAVIHMLVPDEDRNAFYGFVREHLNPAGIALICTMGDGIIESQSDIRTAFEVYDRIHEQTGRHVQIAGTSCRKVSFQTFDKELARNGLDIIEQGITSVEPNFPQMMYAVVGRGSREKREK